MALLGAEAAHAADDRRRAWPTRRDWFGDDSVAPMVSGRPVALTGASAADWSAGATVARCTLLASGRPSSHFGPAPALVSAWYPATTRPTCGSSLPEQHRGRPGACWLLCLQPLFVSVTVREDASSDTPVGHRAPTDPRDHAKSSFVRRMVGGRRPSPHRPGSSSHRPGSELRVARRGCLGQGTRTSFPRTCPPWLMR